MTKATPMEAKINSGTPMMCSILQRRSEGCIVREGSKALAKRGEESLPVKCERGVVHSPWLHHHNVSHAAAARRRQEGAAAVSHGGVSCNNTRGRSV